MPRSAAGELAPDLRQARLARIEAPSGLAPRVARCQRSGPEFRPIAGVIHLFETTLASAAGQEHCPNFNPQEL
jgi:hypothetical protein